MTTEQQAFVLFLSDELRKGMWVPNMQQNEAALRARAAHELRRLHAQTQALIVENKILRAGYDAGYAAARLEIESLQKAATDRHALQATGAHPAPCARYCEAVAFNIERRNLHAENERLRTCNKDAQHEIANLQELAAVGAGGVEPLTDSQIADIYFEALGSQHLREQDRKMVTRFARAIEAAHGITAAQKGGKHGTD